MEFGFHRGFSLNRWSGAIRPVFKTHAASGMKGVPNVAEFLDLKFVPSVKIRIAAFDGENADPANGRSMGEGILAHTPWGEIAYGLAGKTGYERLRKSDEQMVAPGAETIA